MTKKELMENEKWKAMPDDTEIVVNLSGREGDYAPVELNNLTFHNDIAGWVETIKADSTKTREPIRFSFLEIRVI